MFFKQNIDAIALKNESLAKKLSEIYLVIAEENIEVYTAENGDYVFSYDGLVLDDMLDPKEDTVMNCEENIPSDFNKNDTIVVFGLGTGYLLKYISEKYDANILFIEPNLDIFRYGIEFIELDKCFSNPNLTVVEDIENLLNAAKKLLADKNGRLAVIYPASYEQLMPEELDIILSKLTDIAEDIVTD